MHPASDAVWSREHKEVFGDGRTPRGMRQACHGKRLKRTPQGKRIMLEGALVSCTLCHERPD